MFPSLESLRCRLAQYLYFSKATQSDVAKCIGIKQQDISRFLNAQQEAGLSFQNIVALSNWLTLKEANAGAKIVNAQSFGKPTKGNGPIDLESAKRNHEASLEEYIAQKNNELKLQGVCR